VRRRIEPEVPELTLPVVATKSPLEAEDEDAAEVAKDTEPLLAPSAAD
jgi:hypothetical protein